VAFIATDDETVGSTFQSSHFWTYGAANVCTITGSVSTTYDGTLWTAFFRAFGATVVTTNESFRTTFATTYRPTNIYAYIVSHKPDESTNT
jgi:hypothetical protein